MQKKIMMEATKRLGILQEMGLGDAIVEPWENGIACFSKPMEMFGETTGVIFTFNENEELQTIKEKIEEEKEFMVYYAIYDETIYGRMLSLFRVSPYEEDWEMERESLENGYADVYCYNLDEQYGEHGSIGFVVANGGLVRTE